MTQAQMAALTHHGGRIDAAKALFPNAPMPWLDLSTGINPVAWTPPEGLEVDAAPCRIELHWPGWKLWRRPISASRRNGSRPCRAARWRCACGRCWASQPIVAVRPSYGTHGAVASQRVDHDALDDWAGRRGAC